MYSVKSVPPTFNCAILLQELLASRAEAQLPQERSAWLQKGKHLWMSIRRQVKIFHLLNSVTVCKHSGFTKIAWRGGACQVYPVAVGVSQHRLSHNPSKFLIKLHL